MFEHLILVHKFDSGRRVARLESRSHGIEDGPHVFIVALDLVTRGDVIVAMVSFKFIETNC